MQLFPKEEIEAVLITYEQETVINQEIVQLPLDYDGNPFGDTVPFCVGSNQELRILD